MAYRTFVDADGVTWQVWEVRPTTVERRSRERRRQRLSYAGAERRSGVDRRRVREQRISLGPQLAQGWLAFHSASEKRRLAPIPEGWERWSGAQLGTLVTSAAPVPRVGFGHRDHLLKRPA